MMLQTIFLGFVGPWQWIIIGLAILLLFGGKKLPELMKGLERELRNLRTRPTKKKKPKRQRRKNNSCLTEINQNLKSYYDLRFFYACNCLSFGLISFYYCYYSFR